MGRRPDNDPLPYKPKCFICGKEVRDKHDLVKHIIYKTGHLELVYSLMEENELLKSALTEWRALARARAEQMGLRAAEPNPLAITTGEKVIAP